MNVAEIFSDPYKTVVAGMVVTSFLAALPKPPNKPTTKFGLLYKFLYDWMTGFWSLKTGHQEPNPTQAMSMYPSVWQGNFIPGTIGPMVAPTNPTQAGMVPPQPKES